MKPKRLKVIFARKLRKEQTCSEEMFWQKVRAGKFLGLKFRRQVVLRGFVVDFCCNGKKLVVEIDGGVHNEQKEYDQNRELVLRKAGFAIIRIPSEDICSNIDKVFIMLEQLIQEGPVPLSARRSLSEGGRRGVRGEV
ncbi:MAG: endonuclease domain-containing protein [Candidatus Margulisiibacteriota bacterium]